MTDGVLVVFEMLSFSGNEIIEEGNSGRLLVSESGEALFDVGVVVALGDSGGRKGHVGVFGVNALKQPLHYNLFGEVTWRIWEFKMPQ